MTNIFAAILNNIETATAIVIAIGALIATAINQYKQIKRMLAEKEFMEIAAPFSEKVETKPLDVLNQLIRPPVDSLPSIANSNEGKALIVGQAAIEKAEKENPSILKRLGIHSAVDAVPLISSLYKIIKPLVKK